MALGTVYVKGTSGTVTWASDGKADDGVTSWVLTASREFIETTNINDGAFKSFTPGRLDFTATVDVVNTNPNFTTVGGAEASLALGDGTTTYTFDKTICSDMTITHDTNDVNRTTYTFVNAGASFA
jgi:hypothetical protein